MKEEWRPAVDWEGLYEVSSHGRVRSLDRTVQCKNGQTRRYKGRMLKPAKDGHGYPFVNLYREGKKKTKYVHRLVLETFVSPCPEGMECLHGDGNPANNRLDNLRWDSHSENMRDRVKHGTCHETRKTHCPRGHELSPENTPDWAKRAGQRTCLACERASAYLRYRPDLNITLQVLADQYYAKIMAEATDTPVVARHRDARGIMNRQRAEQRNEQQ